MPDEIVEIRARGAAPSRSRALSDRLFALLSRESSSGQFIPEIDGLRFVAIMAVIFYHLNGFVARKVGLDVHSDALSTLLNKGNFGVQLFFVISGFIISQPFADRLLREESDVPLGRYYTRRLTRLEPPYIINLILIFSLLVLVRGEQFAGLFPHLAASIVYMHNAIYGALSQVNGVAWSLEIECQFYLLAPLLVGVFRVRSTALRRAVLAAAIVTTSIASQLFFASHARWELSIFNFIAFFLTGFLLADIFLVSWKWKPQQTYIWDLLSAAFWVAIAALLHAPASAQWVIPFAILGAYCGAFRGTLFNRVFRNRLVYTIGGMCYTIYLYHFFVISLVGRFGLLIPVPDGTSLAARVILMSIIVVPPVLAICAAFFVIAEKPFMRRNWHVAMRNRIATGLGR